MPTTPTHDDLVYEFAGKIARAMKHLSSSHVYFILQTAFDQDQEMAWDEVSEILNQVIARTQVDWKEPKW